MTGYSQIPQAHLNTAIPFSKWESSMDAQQIPSREYYEEENDDEQDEERSLTDDDEEEYYVDDQVQTVIRASFVDRLCAKTWPHTFIKHLFFFVSWLSAVLVLALQCYIFGVYTREHTRGHDFYGEDEHSHSEGKSRGVATYLGLFIFAEIYQVVATVLVFISSSVLHLYSLVIFLGAMAIYCGIQYHELQVTLIPDLTGNWAAATEGASIAVIAVSCVTCIIQFCISYFWLTDQLGGLSAFDVGLNVKIQRKVMYFHLHRTALFLCAFFFPAFALQFILILISRSDVEFALTIVVMPVSMVVLWFADFCAVRRSKKGLSLCLFVYACGAAYVVFKLVRLYHKYPSDLPGRRSLIAFGIFTLVLLACLAVITILVMSSGDDLKGIIVGYRRLPGYESKQSKTHEFKENDSIFGVTV
ncbi:unnamed protein product [Kuraishia capsulata CBS 1993]|uniref:Uncharacterized protein n=1 Tax=Kuraishia capsulata CBS 1993 TaxID=1382522 RepID=W6MFY3_9ASCO|nr:uncharacterized protein KUCA_T00000288001 [Kuraishia capsulata CBS 1993]CDK24328.1 unnamed protein product [Kuraishia capsulata CBS 1993]